MVVKYAGIALSTGIIAAGLLLATMTPLEAQDVDCSDTYNLPQIALNFCALEDFNTADQELNTTWKTVFAIIKSHDAQEEMESRKGWPGVLLQAQRDWIKFRDSHCESARFAFRGGSIEPLIYHSCRADLTRQRTNQISGLVEE
ncbi:MAG: DUF1311 domain-containing protein [Rhizobiaceae bacterium]|nr:DUF1311 domain-containing protein [Rhizobiaceae bacterium]